jgi:hypothetical protein
MAGSAYAADWNFYGSARVSTFWKDVDVDGGDDPDTQFEEGLQGNARIGANVKVSDELTGRFEYGSGGNGETANVRHLYGEWDFGAGKLLVGKTYTPLNLLGSNQVYLDDGALEGYGGDLYAGRLAQIKLTFGDFQIAFVEGDNVFVNYVADNPATPVDEEAFNETDGDQDIMPAIHLSYALTVDNFVFTMAGGFHQFDIDNGTVDDDVTSWALGLDVAATFGAFYVTAQVNGGTNMGNLTLIDVTGEISKAAAGAGYAAVVGNEVVDNDAMGGRICVGYTFNEMFGVEVGYGYQQTEYDVNDSDEIESQSYYIQFPITLAPGVQVIPEVGVVDYSMDDFGEEQEEITYFGAKWQINF